MPASGNRRLRRSSATAFDPRAWSNRGSDSGAAARRPRARRRAQRSGGSSQMRSPTARISFAVFLPLPVLIPTSPNRVAVRLQNLTLRPNLRRGESVFISTFTAGQIPTAEPPTLPKVHVRWMRMIVRKDEHAIAVQCIPRDFIVRQKGGHIYFVFKMLFGSGPWGRVRLAGSVLRLVHHPRRDKRRRFLSRPATSGADPAPDGIVQKRLRY